MAFDIIVATVSMMSEAVEFLVLWWFLSLVYRVCVVDHVVGTTGIISVWMYILFGKNKSIF